MFFYKNVHIFKKWNWKSSQQQQKQQQNQQQLWQFLDLGFAADKNSLTWENFSQSWMILFVPQACKQVKVILQSSSWVIFKK